MKPDMFPISALANIIFLLENVKQLNFSLQKFESDNIEFEKKCSDLHNSLQEEICLNGVLLAKNQNLSNRFGL
jgi:hypothetical protein